MEEVTANVRDKSSTKETPGTLSIPNNNNTAKRLNFDQVCSDCESDVEEYHDCDNCDDDDDDSSSDCFQYADAYLDDRDFDSLEYDYEPGINLSSMEFSRIIEVGHCVGCRCSQEARQGHCPGCSCHQESG